MANGEQVIWTSGWMLLCQLFLALTQTAFVLGAVYFKYNVNHEDQIHQINPVVFAFIREIIAGTVLCLMAYVTTRSVPKREDLLSLAFVGLMVYFNQLFYILGVELSGVVVATCIQPAIPVFTVALAITLGKEEPSIYKTVGILLASAGSICMVAGGAEGGIQSTGVTSDVMLGNILLFLNTIAMALYYIYAKPFLTLYSPMSVAAWAYVVAAACMGVTAIWYNQFYEHSWYLPQAAYGPLAFWIVICSICGYTIIAWGMKHLPSTQVAAFQCLQPPIGTALGFVVLGEELTAWDLGALGVILGLIIVNRDSKPSSEKPNTESLSLINGRKAVS